MLNARRNETVIEKIFRSLPIKYFSWQSIKIILYHLSEQGGEQLMRLKVIIVRAIIIAAGILFVLTSKAA